MWGWRQKELPAADAARQFAEHLMGVTKTLLTCLEESGGPEGLRIYFEEEGINVLKLGKRDE